MKAIKLLPTFDANAIRTDCETILAASSGSPAGFVGEEHIGWQALTLYSQNTLDQLLDRTPYIQKLLNKLSIAFRLVRIMVLEPGGVIREHSDAFLSTRIVRLHIPVITHPDVHFYIGDQHCDWAPGELWYGDFSQPHHGQNHSDLTRVHLVIDTLVNENLIKLFPGPIPCSLKSANSAEHLLDDEDLHRLSFDFLLPPGFTLPGTRPIPNNQAIPGSLRVVDSELRLFINGQPMLKALPLSPLLVELQGLGLPAQLVYNFHNNKKNVSLEVGGSKIIELSVME